MTQFVIVTGGSGSGKTALSGYLKEQFGDALTIFSLDNCYISHAGNYDHPDAYDWALITKIINGLIIDGVSECPTYDYTTHSRTGEMRTLRAAPIVVIEGIHAAYNQYLRSLGPCYFIEAPPDVRLIRRLSRDTKHDPGHNDARHRDWTDVIRQWREQVQPCYLEYIEPLKDECKVVNNASDNINDCTESRVICDLVSLLKERLVDMLDD